MFALTLLRYSATDRSTLGLLFDTTRPSAPHFLCYTLEDPHSEPKIPGQTRIPAGVYPLALRREGRLHDKYSARYLEMHKGMIWIRHIPDFEWVCFHEGNDPQDTEGCPLIGSRPSVITAHEQSIDFSRNAYVHVYPLLATQIHLNSENSTLTVLDSWNSRI